MGAKHERVHKMQQPMSEHGKSVGQQLTKVRKSILTNQINISKRNVYRGVRILAPRRLAQRSWSQLLQVLISAVNNIFLIEELFLSLLFYCDFTVILNYGYCATFTCRPCRRLRKRIRRHCHHQQPTTWCEGKRMRHR